MIFQVTNQMICLDGKVLDLILRKNSWSWRKILDLGLATRVLVYKKVSLTSLPLFYLVALLISYIGLRYRHELITYNTMEKSRNTSLYATLCTFD